MIWSARVLISAFHVAASLGWSFQNGGSGAPMRAWSCGLTSAVGTAISLAGTSRVPASSAKAAVGTATPSATTTKYNLKPILTGRLLLIERVSWMNPNLRRIVAIFRVVRYSDQRASDLARRHNKTREFQAIVIAR